MTTTIDQCPKCHGPHLRGLKCWNCENTRAAEIIIGRDAFHPRPTSSPFDRPSNLRKVACYAPTLTH